MTDIDREIQMRQERWRRFLDPADESAPPFMFLVRYQDAPLPRPPLWPDLQQERIEWAWQSYQQQLQRTAWLRDDAVPCLQVSTGTEIFAEAFGCPIHRAPDQMPFALPRIRSAAEVASLRVPELSNSSLDYLFAMADELRRRAGLDAVLRLIDIQSPMDIAALIWEKTDFLTSMIVAPEAVAELAAKARKLLTAFLDEWFQRYGTRYVAHYPDYFMDGGITVSEDEVGAVSADMFAAFFRDELVALSTRYGGIGVHCCAHARHQWDHFREIPGLRLLNLNQPHAVVAEAYDFFDTNIAQMHYGYARQGPLASWPQRHPQDRRIVYEPPVENSEQARAAADQFNALRDSG